MHMHSIMHNALQDFTSSSSVPEFKRLGVLDALQNGSMLIDVVHCVKEWRTGSGAVVQPA